MSKAGVSGLRAPERCADPTRTARAPRRLPCRGSLAARAFAGIARAFQGKFSVGCRNPVAWRNCRSRRAEPENSQKMKDHVALHQTVRLMRLIAWRALRIARNKHRIGGGIQVSGP